MAGFFERMKENKRKMEELKAREHEQTYKPTRYGEHALSESIIDDAPPERQQYGHKLLRERIEHWTTSFSRYDDNSRLVAASANMRFSQSLISEKDSKQIALSRSKTSSAAPNKNIPLLVQWDMEAWKNQGFPSHFMGVS